MPAARLAPQQVAETAGYAVLGLFVPFDQVTHLILHPIGHSPDGFKLIYLGCVDRNWFPVRLV